MHSRLCDEAAAATARVSSAMVAAVVGSLYAHPHDDTPQAICAVISDAQFTAAEIAEALDVLHLDGLVRCAGSHWQLTTAGYRCHHDGAVQVS